MSSDPEFRALYDAVAAGKIRPRIDRVFPLSAAAAAYRHMEDGASHGKIVLVPDGSGPGWPDGD
jgi:NADPH:quinone reductase-like Zn-dependent oxidoreductase